MTAYEDILLEGKKEGEKIGEKKGIEKVIIGILKKLPNLSDQAIADIAEVNVESITTIRTKIKAKK